MKKSEAIAKLEWYINEQNAGMVCGEQVLAFVQGYLKMSPPHRTYTDYYDYNGIPNAGSFETADQTWEPENE